ncbi:MAG TPA: nuclear transport factor 2 family protein [Baekduia sp.]
MPWAPELFSAPALQQVRDKYRREHLLAVPFFDGLMAGEVDALVESFAGVPELQHPVRGRIRGERAVRHYVEDTAAWLAARACEVEMVNVVATDGRGAEEVVLHLDDGHGGRVGLPVALTSDRKPGRIVELRLYFSSWPLVGHHSNRPPVLQPEAGLEAPDVAGAYLRALADGDVEAAVAAFEPDACMCEPAGEPYVHRGTRELRALYERFFSNGGGIPLELCTVTDDGRACAVEYNVVTWGRTALSPAAGMAIYTRGESGRLAAARMYDDADPPLPARF